MAKAVLYDFDTALTRFERFQIEYIWPQIQSFRVCLTAGLAIKIQLPKKLKPFISAYSSDIDIVGLESPSIFENIGRIVEANLLDSFKMTHIGYKKRKSPYTVYKVVLGEDLKYDGYKFSEFDYFYKQVGPILFTENDYAEYKVIWGVKITPNYFLIAISINPEAINKHRALKALCLVYLDENFEREKAIKKILEGEKIARKYLRNYNLNKTITMCEKASKKVNNIFRIIGMENSSGKRRLEELISDLKSLAKK